MGHGAGGALPMPGACRPMPKTARRRFLPLLLGVGFLAVFCEQVEAMLGLSLQQTRVYQEAKAEGREEREAEMLKVTLPL